MKKELLLLIAIVSSILFFSCNQKKSKTAEGGKDDKIERLKIALAVLNDLNEDEMNLTNKYPDSIAEVKAIRKAISMKFQKASGSISETEARKIHQFYLNSRNHVISANPTTGVEETLHSLYLAKPQLDTLSTYGTHGIRLYLVKENRTTFSLALVPVVANMKNRLMDGTVSLIMNKLDPCPDMCVGATAPALNDSSDLNFSPLLGGWLKPNLADAAGRILVDDRNIIRP